MIRSCRISLGPLKRWLVQQGQPKYSEQYRLRVWQEEKAELDTVRGGLVAYVQEALDDARRMMRCGLSDSLSPFDDDVPDPDPAANYPAALHRNTLKGYFGETLAGLVVEHFGAFGNDDWHVPAFLFRMHDVELRHLGIINEHLWSGKVRDPDAKSQIRPGRTGDDAVAFRINDEGKITHVLTLEAKCLAKNNVTKIRKAFRNLSAERPRRGNSVWEVSYILSQYQTPQAKEWKRRLLSFYKEDHRHAEHLDGFAYAVGKRPKKPQKRNSWLRPGAPPRDYTGGRRLEAMEFQFTDLKRLIDLLYRTPPNG